MSWAFFQSRSVNTGTTLAFNSNVTSGNLLIVVTGTSAADVTTVTDTVGTTYTKAIQLNGGESMRAAIWYGIAAGSGANTVSITTGSGIRTIAIHEYSGFPASPLDSTISATSTGTAVDSGSCPVNYPNSLLFGAWVKGDASPNTTSTPGSGFTAREDQTNTNVVPGVHTEDKLASAAANATFTANNSVPWTALAASFKITTGHAYSSAFSSAFDIEPVVVAATWLPWVIRKRVVVASQELPPVRRPSPLAFLLTNGVPADGWLPWVIRRRPSALEEATATRRPSPLVFLLTGGVPVVGDWLSVFARQLRPKQDEPKSTIQRPSPLVFLLTGGVISVMDWQPFMTARPARLMLGRPASPGRRSIGWLFDFLHVDPAPPVGPGRGREKPNIRRAPQDDTRRVAHTLEALKGVHNSLANSGQLRKVDLENYVLMTAAHTDTRPPGAADDGRSGYPLGCLWCDTLAGDMWVCISNASFSAIWKRIT